jgi:hypothetical protein
MSCGTRTANTVERTAVAFIHCILTRGDDLRRQLNTGRRYVGTCVPPSSFVARNHDFHSSSERIVDRLPSPGTRPGDLRHISDVKSMG